LEEDLLRVIEEVRSTRKVSGAFNSTFLAFIPKEDKPKSFNDFKPISLCNYTYKILAKILAVMVKKIFSEAISQEQFGFLAGRRIHDAI
jgi:hypothetical protein